MSEQTYTPRAGSKAEAAIAALQARKWLSAADLAAEIECDRANVDGNIAVAITHGVLRRVARDGQAGFALGQTGEPPARDVEDEEGTKLRVQKHRKPKKAAPRQAPDKRDRAKVKKPDGEALYPTKYTVGMLEDGTVVVVDSMGHAIQISPLTARRIADLVAMTG